jgi:hypothetical protein
MKRTIQKLVWGAVVAATMAMSVSAADRVEVSRSTDPISNKQRVSVFAFSEADDNGLSWFCEDKDLITMFLWDSYIPLSVGWGKTA